MPGQVRRVTIGSLYTTNCGTPFRGVLKYFRMYLSTVREFHPYLKTGGQIQTELSERGLRPAGCAS